VTANLKRAHVCVSACVWVMITVRLRVKVKVIGQGQMSMSSAYGHGNAVVRSDLDPRSRTVYLVLRLINQV